jgi:hypothetical protein
MKFDVKLAMLEYEYAIEIQGQRFMCERPREYQVSLRCIASAKVLFWFLSII